MQCDDSPRQSGRNDQVICKVPQAIGVKLGVAEVKGIQVREDHGCVIANEPDEPIDFVSAPAASQSPIARV